jgi:hypothetical protein
VRAAHFNELRAACEYLRRGRWTMPLYLPAGLFSLMPGTPWIGDSIANNGADELRAVGRVYARVDGPPTLGLTGVTVRPATAVEVTADVDCRVELWRCLRPLALAADPPTWNHYDPSAPAAWTDPGGTGAGDAERIGSAELAAGVPARLEGAAVAAAVQAMADGAEQTFLLRRDDTGAETVAVTARLIAEFDLDIPPN